MSLDKPSTAGLERKTSAEVMGMPEVVIREERGMQLLSLLLKAADSAWEETNTPLAKDVMQYFARNPLSVDISGTISHLHNEGVDEETLYHMALTYGHPERAEEVFSMIEKHKPHVQNPQEKREQLSAALGAFDRSFSTSPLAAKFSMAAERDIAERRQRLEAAKARIQKLIDFFRPDPRTSDIKRVAFTPTDPLQRRSSGRAFSAFPGELIISSHIDNVLNQDHEFSHGFINPIVEDKLVQQLTNEQQHRVIELASTELRQDYGDNSLSLLCEELIRTYTELVAQGKRPPMYDEFADKISDITETEFQGYLAESSSLRQRCAHLAISSVADFRAKSREYYEQFEVNRLRNLIFELYQEYSNRADANQDFEQFLTQRFPALL